MGGASLRGLNYFLLELGFGLFLFLFLPTPGYDECLD